MKIYLVKDCDRYSDFAYIVKAFKTKEKAELFIAQQKEEYIKCLKEAKKCDKCISSTKKQKCFVPSKENPKMCDDELPSYCMEEIDYIIVTTELEE